MYFVYRLQNVIKKVTNNMIKKLLSKTIKDVECLIYAIWKLTFDIIILLISLDNFIGFRLFWLASYWKEFLLLIDFPGAKPISNSLALINDKQACWNESFITFWKQEIPFTVSLECSHSNGLPIKHYCLLEAISSSAVISFGNC